MDVVITSGVRVSIKTLQPPQAYVHFITLQMVITA